MKKKVLIALLIAGNLFIVATVGKAVAVGADDKLAAILNFGLECLREALNFGLSILERIW